MNWNARWLGQESDLLRMMKPSFGWRSYRYAKYGYILLSQMEGMSLPSSCKHRPNPRLRWCLQKAIRHVSVLHPKRWTFLRVIWKARKFVVGLEMPIGTKWLGMPMVWLRKRLLPPEAVTRQCRSHLRAVGEVTAMQSATA